MKSNLSYLVTLLIFCLAQLNGQGVVSEVSSPEGDFGYFGLNLAGLAFGSQSIQTKSILPNTNQSLLVNLNGGKVGVGTFNPIGKLDVYHDSDLSSPTLNLTSVNTTNGDGGLISFKNEGSDNSYELFSGNLVQPFLTFRFYDQTAYHSMMVCRDGVRMYLNNSDAPITYTGELRAGVIQGGQTFNMLRGLKMSNLGLGTSWEMDFHAHIGFYYEGNWVSTILADGEFFTWSDRRAKTEIEPLDYGLKHVLKLKPYSYSFKHDQSAKPLTIGFVAQEVLEIIPEVVDYVSETDLYAMSYQNLSTILIKSISDRQKQIDRIKANQINQRQQIARLKQAL